MTLKLLLVAAVIAAAPAQAEPAAQEKAAILAEYIDLLAIPNVATNVSDIRRNADHIMAMMTRRGLAPRLLEGDNANVPPAIYGEWPVPGAKKTLVLYAHYDGQPVTPEDWKSTQTFEPKYYTDRLDRGGKQIAVPAAGRPIDPEWRIYARSASDDKLGVMAILKAVDTLKAQGKRPAYNLKVFFEGEEEQGSPNLAALLAKHQDTLKSDGWVIFDGPSHPSGAPQVSLGVRGDINVDVTVHGPTRPLHSGHYGNWVPNPAMVLSQLLASMKDKDGRVTVAGWYDDVVPLTEAEQAAIRAVPAADAQLKSELGLGWTEGNGISLLDAIQQPSLNINGIRAADVGDKARNVIPISAAAALDLRLVKGNDSKRQVEKLIRHIQAQGFLVLDREPTMAERQGNPRIATVIVGPGYNAERTALDNPLAQSVAAAMKPYGAVVLPSLGGSLPLYLFRETLGAPTVSVSLANHDNNQHAEDENLRIGNLWRAIDIAAAVMQAR
ncbi:M20/M25/M40 family metallo-hydrolase [Sphingomonas sp. NSE70-1]|uniref:M20/M25/M40 family metallo-hydrolase n=1 Tax=Sphingomonas caseinilyticus TaxID=2908205 RepID=A0ABT0RVL8_9SPHN|nr:M20/M25/M40 family metallo-hydrolase [Sphingomonas caseinilyticus]MCL6698996.1 M20/M25/M40 family metallo-hydrolase [Sphingomonas caseinilyticus]